MGFRPLILDGGLATYLNKQGDPVESDPLWSSRLLLTEDGRRRLAKAHYDFLQSGSDIITTASYQISIELLKKCIDVNITEDECRNLVKSSVRVAREASDKFWNDIGGLKNELDRVKPSVAGSVGPYGACLLDGSEYHGKYLDSVGLRQLKDWHRPRIEALVEAGVDFLACETLPGLVEAQAILEVVKEVGGQQKLWISFTCKNGKSLSHGEDFAEALETVWKNKSDGLVAVGINCTNPADVIPLLKSVPEGLRHVPVVIYPNSGEGWKRGTGWLGNAVSIAESVPLWMEEWPGIFAIGGCCRVFPEDIAEIRSALYCT